MKNRTKSTLANVIYSAISKYSSVLLSVIVGAVLARLLGPEEFGLVAVVTVFTTFFSLLSDFGIGPAVVQSNELNDQDIQSIFSFSIIFGFILSLLFFSSSTFIANFYEKPILVQITRILSFSVFFYSIQVVPYALCQKQMLFLRMGIINTSVQLLTSIFAIILAYYKFGSFSLVFKTLADSILLFISYYSLTRVNIMLKIKKESIKKIIKFSSYQFLFNFINYFSRNSDNILIGKYMSVSTLGLYDKAYKLMMLPVSTLTHVITPVILPVLSKYQDNKELIFNKYLLLIRILAIIGFPLTVFLYFSAYEIISILYGQLWISAIVVFKILSLTIGIQMLLSSSGSIFQAINRTDLLFTSGLISSLFMVSGICYGIFYKQNLEAVGIGLLVAFIINFFQGFYILVVLGLKSSLVSFLKSILYPLLISLILAIILAAFTRINIPNILLSICIKALISVITVLVFILINNELKYSLISVLRR